MSKIFVGPAQAPRVLPAGSEPNMQRFAAALGRITDVCLYLAFFLTPLFFSTSTLDVLELSKQSLIVFLAVTAFIAWLANALAGRHVTLARSWLHPVVAFFGAGYLLISFFSQDKYLSMVGHTGQQAWSFATIAALILFYTVIVNRVRSLTQVYHLIFVFLASSSVVALYGLAQIFGWHVLRDGVTQTRTFNTIGSVFSLAVYLSVPLVIAASIACHGCRDRICLLGAGGMSGVFSRSVVWLCMASALAVLLVIDFWPAWTAVLFGTALSVGLGYLRSRKTGCISRLSIPLAIMIIAALMLAFQTLTIQAPWNISLPSEVAPSAVASWIIARQTLQSQPLFGSGPGTWMYDYAKYRVQPINLSPFWNIRFDRGVSSFLTLLATVGLFGAGLLLILLASAAGKSVMHLLRERDEDAWRASLMVFCGWSTAAFVFFAYNFNVAHQAVFWFLLALLGCLVVRQVFSWDIRRNARAFAILSVIFFLTVLGGISFLWLTGQRFAAETAFSRAVRMFRENKPLEQVMAQMDTAMMLNGWNDAYARNQSQAKLLQITQLMQQRPSPEQFKTVHRLVSQAVSLGIAARDSNPANVENWSNLAFIYQSVASFTSGADEHAIKNYEGALAREPQNPVFLNEIGRLYLLRADAYRAQLESRDQSKAPEARVKASENLKLALEWLKKAVAAKTDYFPARYHLGLVYERQGRLAEAIAELTEALRANNKDSGLAFELAILHYRNRQPDAARSLLEQIVRVEPSQANARWYLAALYEESGRFSDAIVQMEALIKQLPDHADITQKLEALRQAQTARSAPSVRPLPEPIKEDVVNPTTQNPLKK